MKREEIKAVLENAELDTDAKLKAIMDANGADLTELKTSNKALNEQVKGLSDLQAKLEEANKSLESYKGFEDKAKKYDEMLPAFEQYQKDEKVRKVTEAARKAGIRDDFIEFAASKVGEVEDYDEAFKKFITENKQYAKETVVPGRTSPELGKGSPEPEPDYSKMY